MRYILSKHISKSINRGTGFLYRKVISILLYYQRVGYLDFRGYTCDGKMYIILDQNPNSSFFIEDHGLFIGNSPQRKNKKLPFLSGIRALDGIVFC